MPDKKGSALCCEELERFCQSTSLKGVGRATKTNDVCLRSIWVIAVVLFLFVTVFNVYKLISEYLAYPTGTKIVEKSIDFVDDKNVDIMLCNINPFSSAELAKTISLKNSYGDLIRNWTSGGYQNIRYELLTGQSGLYQHIGREEASFLSHTLRSFVLGCYIHFVDGVMERKIPCSRTRMKVKKIVNTEYFNCYKFVGGDQTSGSIPTSGVSFLLYIDDSRDTEMGRNISIEQVGKGAILTLGQQNSFLDPDSSGIEILPNRVNVVRFKVSDRIRIKKPHGSCQERRALFATQNEKFNSSYVYTKQSCYSSCIEYYVIKECGCRDVGQYGTLNAQFTNISMCGSTSEGRDVLLERMTCVQKWRGLFRNTCLSTCTTPCLQRTFGKCVSYLELIPREIKHILSEEQDRSSVPDLVMDDDTQQHIQSPALPLEDWNTHNMAWVRIRRESNNYYLIEDTVKITFSDLLAKLGGTMNLWSGITVFVIVEFIDIAYRLCKKLFSSDMRINDKRVKTSQKVNSGEHNSVGNYHFSKDYRTPVA